MDVQYRIPVKGNVGSDKPEHTLPRTGYRIKDPSARAKEQKERNVRFPYIHSNELDPFHSLKALLSINHRAVPSWRASLAVL